MGLQLRGLKGAALIPPHIARVLYPNRVKNFVEVRRITRLIHKQSIAREAYDEAKLAVAPDTEKIRFSKEAVVRLSNEVLAARRLIQVMPDESSRDLHVQLVNNEKVHLFKEEHEEVTQAHINELLANRLGGEGMNKDCMALVVPTKFGSKILGAIFRYHVEVPLVDGLLDLRHIPGNVDNIKNNPVEPLTGRENLTLYWTISSGWNGSGPILVRDLKEATPKGRFESTDSPIHAYNDQNDRDEIFSLSDEEIRQRVLNYLISEKDSVRNFHMGNGAFLGQIHVNRDAPEGSRDWITVSYIYDRTRLSRHQEMFRAGVLPLAPHIYATLAPDQVGRAYNVSSESLISHPSNAIS